MQHSIDEISQSLAIPKSTVYRYVRVLCDKGFLERTAGGHYQLGLTFLALSRVALNSNRDIRTVVLPAMTRIAGQFGESVSLMRLFHHQAVCIETIEGQRALRVTMEHGRVQPLHAGASSKLLLASRPESEWKDLLDFPLQHFTDTTITDFHTLVDDLRRIRQEGYSISDGEIDTGARAIAIPLMNNRGDMIAALSIEGPASRIDDDTVGRFLETLRHEAQLLQDQLS